MRPKRYEPYGEHVFAQIEEAPQDVMREFLALLEQLAANPFPAPDNRVLPHKEHEHDLPQSFSAPFDDGLLLYQVMADFPILKLIQVTWL